MDDGISGTTFEREGFQQMISDIEKGEVKAVIVKDQSRLGRDHLMTGYYMEVFFPNNDVRFVAIYDNYDSEIGDNEFAPFKNIFNEFYTSFLKTQNNPNAHKPYIPTAKIGLFFKVEQSYLLYKECF